MPNTFLVLNKYYRFHIYEQYPNLLAWHPEPLISSIILGSQSKCLVGRLIIVGGSLFLLLPHCYNSLLTAFPVLALAPPQPFLPKAEQTWVSSLSVRDIPSYQGHQVGPNLGQHDFQAHFYKEISTWEEKTRLANKECAFYAVGCLHTKTGEQVLRGPPTAPEANPSVKHMMLQLDPRKQLSKIPFQY